MENMEMRSLVVDTPFWHGKKVFLTGHTGFKGTWLTLLLEKLGIELKIKPYYKSGSSIKEYPGFISLKP